MRAVGLPPVLPNNQELSERFRRWQFIESRVVFGFEGPKRECHEEPQIHH